MQTKRRTAAWPVRPSRPILARVAVDLGARYNGRVRLKRQVFALSYHSVVSVR